MRKSKWIACTVIAFFVLNGLGIWKALSLWEAHLQGRYPDPELVESPQEETPMNRRQPLRWVWDLPVVSDEVIGEDLHTSPVEMDPIVAGVYQWKNDRTLTFAPQEDWPVAQKIHVKLDTVLTNRHGRVQAVHASHALKGPRLNVQNFETSMRWDRQELQLRLRFNQRVLLKDLRQHVLLVNERGEKMDFQLQSTPQPEEFLIQTEWRRAKTVSLVLKEGLPSALGPVGALGHEKVFPVNAPHRFAYKGRQMEQPTFGPGHVDLSFSSPPDFQSLQDGVLVEPSVDVTVGRGRWWRGNHARITGEFQPGVRYTFTLTKGVKGMNGQPLLEPVQMDVIFPEPQPGLEFAHSGWVLNAEGARQIALNTQNEGGLSLALHRVHENNQIALAVRKSGSGSYKERSFPDQKLTAKVWSSEMPVVENGMTTLDLSDALDELGKGVYRLSVKGRTSRKTVQRLLVVSDVGLLARRHGEEIMVWCVGLRKGEPRNGLEITIWSDTRQPLGTGTTDAQGLVRIPLLPDPTLGRPLVVMAKGDDSLGMLTLDRIQVPEGVKGERPFLTEGHEAYVYTSKGLYRPAETVHARAIVRGKGFTLPEAFPLKMILKNPAGQTVWEGLQTLSDVGTVTAEVDLRPEWPNGSYQFQVSLPGEDSPVWGQTRFTVESFVPPQVVVEASTPSGKRFVDPKFEVLVDARMLYGGAASSHAGYAMVTLEAEEFRSSDYPDYRFSDDRKTRFTRWSRNVGAFETDAQGKARFTINLPEDKISRSALRAVVGLSVKEFSGRTATAFVSRRIDRVSTYMGIRTEVKEDQQISVDVVGVDREGHRIPRSPEVDVEWFRVNWQRGYRRNSNGQYIYMSQEVAVSEGKRKLTLHQGQAELGIRVHGDGNYRVVVTDPETGFSTTSRIWVGKGARTPERADKVVLTLDQNQYASGDQATVQVDAPFDGQALLTVESHTLLLQDVISVENRRGEFRFTVPEQDAANLWVRAVAIRPQPGEGEAPVLRAEGAVPLQLDTRHLEQDLTLSVEETLQPASTIELVLTGTPGAETVVAGVDEGILRLTQFQTPDPGTWFRVLRRIASVTWDGFDELMPELGKGALAGDSEMGGGGAGSFGRRLNPVDAKRFTPLTWWSGVHRFPEDGVLRLRMEMPEFSGRIRWMAVQVGRKGMGATEASSHVARDVVSQQSLPLFLAPGDVTDWTVRLHNQSDHIQTLRLQPEFLGPVDVEGNPVTLKLDPGEVRSHRWRVKANNAIGVARCTLNIEMGETHWEDTIELAVRPVEAFTVSSQSIVLPPGESLELSDPAEMLEGTLQRSFQVSSLPALQLEGAVQYLLRYPYGCLEQTVSAASPALVMPQWVAETKEGAQLIVEAGIQSLWRKQLSDGSFGYWSRRERTSVSGTFMALEFLLDAREQGYKVHEPSLAAGVEWTRRWLAGRNWSSTSSKQNHQLAYASLILAKAGELNPGWVQRLRERRDDLDRLSRVRSAETMVILGHRPEAMKMLHGVTSGDEYLWDWWSATSTNAYLLYVLLQIDPQDGRIPELMEHILSKRNQQGRWGHTYENASVLKALVSYAAVYGREAETPNVQLQLRGGGPEKVTPDQVTPLVSDAAGRLTNQGSRPVYIEERTEGIPLLPPEIEDTFKLTRTLYRPKGIPVKAGESVASGELLAVVMEIANLPQPMKHMVIDQRLPAGLEPLPASAQNRSFPLQQVPTRRRPDKPRHLEVRDDRVLLFPHRLSQRHHVFVVWVRAVTPGEYRFPALFAQGMYQEDVQARTTEIRLQVTP